MAAGLRDLPSDNVRVVEAEAPCHPLGNLGWLLRNRLQPSLYSHFVLVNSRVRGPFLPPYAQVRRGGGALPLPPAHANQAAARRIRRRADAVRLLGRQGKQPWHALVTRRLRHDVRMVGPTLSCSAKVYRGARRKVPHIPLDVLAIEKVHPCSPPCCLCRHADRRERAPRCQGSIRGLNFSRGSLEGRRAQLGSKGGGALRARSRWTSCWTRRTS